MAMKHFLKGVHFVYAETVFAVMAMKHFLKGLYFVYVAAPLAYSISVHLLAHRASVLIGHPPQYLVNSPQDLAYGGDAIYDRFYNLTSVLEIVCWLLFLGSLPILMSLLFPTASRFFRFVIFVLSLAAWSYWGSDPLGGWFVD